MNLLLLPDFIAITLLVFVLLRVRGKRQEGVLGLWAAGLLLILLECVARIVYEMHTIRSAHLVAHVIALNSYGLAASIFLLSASQALRRMPRGRMFLLVNVLPHLLLFTAYGLDLRQKAVYWTIAAAGLCAGVLSPILLLRITPLYGAFALIWTPLLICIHHGDYRSATYVGLFFLYGLSALFFAQSLPRASHGKIAVVAGFSMWALCFLTHPWIASSHPAWIEFASQLWNMQKFIITVGLLLVMLEEQVRSNEWLALHDGLTGLPNRRLFEDRLQHALLNAQRTRSRLALFTLDLDGFKQVNDTLGHDAGDILLKGVSANLLQSLRRSDTLARLGGDEFTLIAADLDGAPGNRVAGSVLDGRACAASQLPQVQRILTAMAQGIELPVALGEIHGGRTVSVSASIGVAIYPDEGTTAEELMRLADQRMYKGKRQRAQAHKQTADEAHTDLDLQRV